MSPLPKFLCCDVAYIGVKGISFASTSIVLALTIHLQVIFIEQGRGTTFYILASLVVPGIFVLSMFVQFFGNVLELFGVSWPRAALRIDVKQGWDGSPWVLCHYLETFGCLAALCSGFLWVSIPIGNYQDVGGCIGSDDDSVCVERKVHKIFAIMLIVSKLLEFGTWGYQLSFLKKTNQRGPRRLTQQNQAASSSTSLPLFQPAAPPPPPQSPASLPLFQPVYQPAAPPPPPQSPPQVRAAAPEADTPYNVPAAGPNTVPPPPYSELEVDGS